MGHRVEVSTSVLLIWAIAIGITAVIAWRGLERRR